jgi:hypothetical protein
MARSLPLFTYFRTYLNDALDRHAKFYIGVRVHLA